MNRKKLKLPTIITHVCLIACALVWIYPFAWMVATTFKSKDEFFTNKLSLIPTEFTFDNLIRVWGDGFNLYFFNTVVVTVGVVLLVLIMTSMSGYVLGRYNFVGKKIVMGVFVASITIPLASTIIPTFEIVKGMGLVGTRLGLILSSAGGAHVIFLLLFSGFYKQLPNDMEEAARMDGCGFFRTYFDVMMPLGAPIAVTVVIMETIWTWNAFLLPLVLTLNTPEVRTLAVGMYAFQGENTVDWTALAAGGTIAVVPIIIVFISLQKYFVDGVAGAVKS